MIAFRTAKKNERLQLIELQRRASLANEGDRAVLLENPDAVDLPAQQIEAGDVIVALLDNQPAGFSAIYIRDDGAAELDGLFVEPSIWKSGLGRTLVENAAIRAKTRGAGTLHVIGNPHVEGFYLKVGFVVTGKFETEFGPGITMELALT